MSGWCESVHHNSGSALLPGRIQVPFRNDTRLRGIDTATGDLAAVHDGLGGGVVDFSLATSDLAVSSAPRRDTSKRGCGHRAVVCGQRSGNTVL